MKARVGESVAVDGVCLTLAEKSKSFLRFRLAEETLQDSTLSLLKPGDLVNLEPALRAGDPIGGHWVSGHVDAVGRVLGLRRQGDFARIVFATPKALRGLIAEKGSVAVNGVSLTAREVLRDSFSVAIVPFTWRETNLSRLRVGSRVNLEADLVARYVKNTLEAMRGGR